MSILDRISNPRDLDGLTNEELVQLSDEIRKYLVETVAKTGGHLGPNLGVVELTLAIHRIFDSPSDPIIFDTGHQSYVHKLLTGRKDLSTIRQKDGLAGYPQRSESEHDIVESSHASASLSWADGIARALHLAGESERTVVAVVGDGALTGGMTWEAFNSISEQDKSRLVIVVNDNGRSYAPTIGGLARTFNEMRTKSGYRKAYLRTKKLASKFGRFGQRVYEAGHAAGNAFFTSSAPKGIHPSLGIKYIGPIPGHDIEALEQALRQAKDYGHPVIVHVVTEKGRGFKPALEDTADQFHAIGRIDPETGVKLDKEDSISWTEAFGNELLEIAGENEQVVGITAAMLQPVGMKQLQQHYPKRVFDVGIAEQHAVTMAAGMAYVGLHPVVAIYSTFMNRAVDQVIMDVALHKAGVTFVLDRSGVTGPDGPSHHGVWDLSIFQAVPGIRIAAPRDADSLREELREAIAVNDAPTMIRFPKGAVGAKIEAIRRTDDGVDILKMAAHQDVLIVAVGTMAEVGLKVVALLEAQGIGASVIDPRWVIPVADSIVELSRNHRIVAVIEDGIKVGGIGTSIRQKLRAAGVDTAVDEIGLPGEFLAHASRSQILEEVGLTPRQIALDLTASVMGKKVPVARPLPETSVDVSSDIN
ncbi:MAG: 1-deoxy-D-xylulose-5-phosphate synthase [Microbacteriaceae bacterium]|nr:1-deoxy-D-xylulose-5-phosphate synthase [Microbacteriaceae bacterium]